MGGVNEVKLTESEKISAREQQRQAESEFAQELVEGLDLPAGVRREVDKVAKEGKKNEALEEKEDAESEEEKEETSEEEVSEEGDAREDGEEESDNAEESEEDESEEEDAEESDPKTVSSMQKRIDELTAEKRRLESENAKLKGTDKKSEEGDLTPQQKKLSTMSVKELRELRDETLLAFKEEKDPREARKLLNLEHDINDAISSAPARFEQSQLASYHDAVRETSSEFGEKFTPEVQKEIFKRATNIFLKSSALQRSVDGQAIAWQQAVDTYKEVSKFSAGKSRTQELERENNKLKKKTALDVAVRKGNTKTSENERLFQRAKTGSPKDKLAFFKNEFRTDDMLPENLRGR